MKPVEYLELGCILLLAIPVGIIYAILEAREDKLRECVFQQIDLAKQKQIGGSRTAELRPWRRCGSCAKSEQCAIVKRYMDERYFCILDFPECLSVS